MSERFAPADFVPANWLKNRHLQTFAAALGRVEFLPVAQKLFVRLEDENQVRCDCSWQPQPETKTTALIIHGLGGSSDSPVVVGMATALWRAGMNIARYNMRNCGGTEAYCKTLYHSGMYGDVVAVLHELIAQGCQSIVLVGFSAGGNLALNTAAALGADAPHHLRAVASICGAMDVSAAADALHQGISRFYEWRFIRELVDLFRAKARLFPEIFQVKHLHRFHSIREFDHGITAPYSGYRGAEDLYSSISSSRWAERIGVPTLVINAKDDPFIRLLPNTRNKLANNPRIAFLEPEHGGHCGFVAQGNTWWAEQTVEAFLASVLCEDRSSHYEGKKTQITAGC